MITVFFKLFIINVLIINFSHAKTFFSKDCNTPESVYFDLNSKSIFISNIVGQADKKDQKGYISRLDHKGEVINSKWITGLNAPKGMRSFKNHLWVTDIDRVIKINIKKGQIIQKINIPKARFLNDLAIDSDETLYVSDTLDSKIYKIKDSKVSIFAAGKKYQSPNGLLIDKDQLLVASWGLTKDWTTKIPGKLYSIHLKNKKITQLTSKPLGNLDGLELDKDNNILVSDWVSGLVYKIKRNGSYKIIYRGSKGLADIAYLPFSDTILAPLMNDHKVISIPNPK